MIVTVLQLYSRIFTNQPAKPYLIYRSCLRCVAQMIATVFAFDPLSGLIKSRYLLNDVSEVSSVTKITKLVVKWYKWKLQFRVFVHHSILYIIQTMHISIICYCHVKCAWCGCNMNILLIGFWQKCQPTASGRPLEIQNTGRAWKTCKTGYRTLTFS